MLTYQEKKVLEGTGRGPIATDLHVTVHKQGCEIGGGERQTKYVHRHTD